MLLSKREVEVLALIAAGKSNKDAADILCIAESTVKSHLTNARRKLDALTTAQAINTAWEFGIFTVHRVIDD